VGGNGVELTQIPSHELGKTLFCRSPCFPAQKWLKYCAFQKQVDSVHDLSARPEFALDFE